MSKKLEKIDALSVGVVNSVDTIKVKAIIEDENKLNKLRLNDLVFIQGGSDNEFLIGIINKNLLLKRNYLK